MGFKYEELFSSVKTYDAEFKPHKDIADGEGLQLNLSNDIISIDFLEMAARNIQDIMSLPVSDSETSTEDGETTKPKKTAKKSDVSAEDTQKSLLNSLEWFKNTTDSIMVMARILGGRPGETNVLDRVIQSWDLEKKGEPVAVSYEELSKWKFSLLQKLYNFCIYEAQNPEKKK
jgi:hypothetical protein